MVAEAAVEVAVVVSMPVEVDEVLMVGEVAEEEVEVVLPCKVEVVVEGRPS